MCIDVMMSICCCFDVKTGNKPSKGRLLPASGVKALCKVERINVPTSQNLTLKRHIRNYTLQENNEIFYVNKDISRDMGSAAEGQDSRAPACQDSMS